MNMLKHKCEFRMHVYALLPNPKLVWKFLLSTSCENIITSKRELAFASQGIRMIIVFNKATHFIRVDGLSIIILIYELPM